MLSENIRYMRGVLCVDDVELSAIAAEHGTPTYVYSLPRAVANFDRLRAAFAPLNAHIHYSAKANANLHLLRALINAGAGVDVVSGGEIVRALRAGASPENIVFAGVGKTHAELKFAVEQGVGWFNVENVFEVHFIQGIAASLGASPRVALRFNPDVQANTHGHIATGHKSAKFGLSADEIRKVIDMSPSQLKIEGIHVHIGSQLGDSSATVRAVERALDLIRDYPQINTVNIGGGFPAPYTDEALPSFEDFARALAPLLEGYNVIVEPGRSIVADAGILLTKVLYNKHNGDMVVCDAGMTELIRPALYGAEHAIVPVAKPLGPSRRQTVVGPVCETADVISKNVALPTVMIFDLLAILDTGAYGMVMASNYNQRPRPAEVVVDADGARLSRRRETYEDLMRDDIFEPQPESTS